MAVDLVGQRFGKLVVTALVARDSKHSRWACRCDCGRDHEARLNNLRRGVVRSCGCALSEHISASRKVHGYAKTPTWRSWISMRRRCTAPADPLFPYYGARGIKVCDRWLNSFAAFLEDMGERPKGLTIERRDNDGDYTPNNCRWATRAEQARNKRNTTVVEYCGVRMSIAEACERAGLRLGLVQERVRKQWAVERLFLPPLKPHERINARR